MRKSVPLFNGLFIAFLRQLFNGILVDIYRFHFNSSATLLINVSDKLYNISFIILREFKYCRQVLWLNWVKGLNWPLNKSKPSLWNITIIFVRLQIFIN